MPQGLDEKGSWEELDLITNQKLIFGQCLPKRPGRINFLVISGFFRFGAVRAGIEVETIFTILNYVKIVPLDRFAQCY